MNKKIWGWDACAAVAISLLCILIIWRENIFPVFIDIFYHLSIAEMFNQAGGVTTADFLQFAPGARPHLYPPVYHILLSLPKMIGIDALLIAKVASAATYPFVSLSLYLTAGRAFSKRIGFFSLVVFLSPWMIFYKTAYLGPSMMAVALAMLAYYCMCRKSYLSACAFSALALYTHMSIPHMFLIPIIVVGLLHKEERKKILLAISCAYAAYVPFAVHLFASRGYVTTRDIISENNVYVASALLGIAGIVIILYRYRKKEWDSLMVYPIAVLLFLGCIYPHYPHRYWFHAYVPISILSAVAIDHCIGWIKKRPSPGAGPAALAFMVAIVVLMVLYTPTYTYYSHPIKGGDMGNPFDSNDDYLTGTFQSEGIRIAPAVLPVLARGYSLIGSQAYIGKDFYAIAEDVASATCKDDIIQIMNGPRGCFISATTGRATTLGMFFEVLPYEPNAIGAPITKAYVLDYEITEDIEEVTEYIGNGYTLMVRDNGDVAKTAIPSPIVPIVTAQILCTLTFLLGLTVFFRR